MTKKLPFGNLFGKGVTRVVIPYQNDPNRSRIEKELNQAGYDRVDWNAGMAYKTIQPRIVDPQASPKAWVDKPGNPEDSGIARKIKPTYAPADAKPKIQAIKIGKAVSMLPDGKKWIDWYSQQKDHEKDKEQLSIVISRNPIDVVRMSDHDGIQSCHSPDGGYFGSCLQEMRHGGLIAYLVKTDELNKFTPQQIAGTDEIFHDSDRDQEGIVPITRVRLRRYTSNDDSNLNLALPELRTYGKINKEFQRQVTDWAKEKQEDVIGGKRLRMKDFHRRGGSYADNSDGDLFNNLFGDNKDSGSTKYGNADKEGEDLATQQRTEIEQFHTDWERKFKQVMTTYEEMDGEDDENGVTFYWDASISVDVPADKLHDDIPESQLNRSWGPRDKDNPTLKDALGAADFYTGNGDISFDSHGDKAYLHINIYPEDNSSGGPDEYNEFCQEMEREWDKAYPKLQATVFKWLVDRGHMDTTPVRDFAANQPRLTYFKIEHEDGDLEAKAEIPIGQAEVLTAYDGGYKNPRFAQKDFEEPVQEGIRKLVFLELQRMLAVPPDRMHKPAESYNLKNFQVRVTENEKKKFNLEISFAAHDATSKEDIAEMNDLLVAIDRIVPKLTQECQRWLANYEHQYKQERDKPTQPTYTSYGGRYSNTGVNFAFNPDHPTPAPTPQFNSGRPGYASPSDRNLS